MDNLFLTAIKVLSAGASASWKGIEEILFCETSSVLRSTKEPKGRICSVSAFVLSVCFCMAALVCVRWPGMMGLPRVVDAAMGAVAVMVSLTSNELRLFCAN